MIQGTFQYNPSGLAVFSPQPFQMAEVRSRPPSSRMESRICELELQQTQLKMRNNELADEKNDLRSQLTELYDSHPLGYAIFDEQGLIKVLNLAGAEILHGERKQLLEEPFIHFVAEKDRPLFLTH